ncbi:glutaredoxin 3 [Myxosarcina sp. GI1(2024)]
MKPNVEIYTWSHCPHSAKAKALLQQKEIAYTEYSIDGDDEAREAMSQRANGRKTVPQIFINNTHIGGCEDLHTLEEIGSLDELLIQEQQKFQHRAYSLNSET